jgi:amidophosphoribosyltransferase
MAEEIGEECGVMAVFGGPEVTRRVVMGLYSLQHRGQESVGVAATNGDDIHLIRRMGLVTELNKDEKEIAAMTGLAAIGHVRYSTTGVSSITNAQPMLVSTKRGPIALAHNGNITNANHLRSEMEEDGHIFQSTSDTEILLHMVARSKKEVLMDALEECLQQLSGSFSMVFLTRHEVYIARDPFGFRPLCLGRLDRAWVIAS